MKSKTLRFALLATMAILLILAVVGYYNGAVYTTFLAFPFQQIIILISYLSGKGIVLKAIGNFTYLVLTLSPIIYLVNKVIKKKFSFEDLILVLLGVSIGYTLYLGLNPHLVDLKIDSKEAVVERYTILSMINYWILISYLVIKLVKNIEKIKPSDTILYIQYLLTFIGLIIIVNVIGVEFPNYISQLKNLGVYSFDDANLLGPIIIYIFISLLSVMIPAILAIFLVFSSLELNKRNFEVGIKGFAIRIRKASKLYLLISFAIILCYSFISIFFIKYVDISGMMSMSSIISLIVMLTFYITSTLILKNKILEEKSRFIA